MQAAYDERSGLPEATLRWSPLGNEWLIGIDLRQHNLSSATICAIGRLLEDDYTFVDREQLLAQETEAGGSYGSEGQSG